MSDGKIEVDPFSETTLEFQSCEGVIETIIQSNTKEESQNITNELTYAEPLTAEQIRWFYRDGVDKRWVEFCGYDSLRIENAWQSYQHLFNKDSDVTNNALPIEKIVVRGGMYDVELDKMKCVSIYCPGEEWEIMRGTWYYDGSWLPLETEQSKIIEEVHLNLFQKQLSDQATSTYDTPHSYKILHTENFPEFHVDWHSINDVVLYSEYRHSKLMRSVTSKLGFTKSIVEAITPFSVVSIRHLLNTSAMDILYYTSPLYGGEVRAGLQKELNRLYLMFASRHPGWKGKVSILAHSLGCVIVYDIVTGWMGPDTRPPSPETQEVLKQRLQFPIENLFCLGSPLSVFLALRTPSLSNKTDVMPQDLCKRFYNIFHWSDPVAYRMEPLLEREYSKIEPVLIPSYGGVDGQQTEQSPPTINNPDQNFSPTDNDEREDNSVDISNRTPDKGWSLWGLVRAGWNVKEGVSTPIQPGQELTQRLDYVLRASLGRNYFYTLAAHTTYWSNYDVAYFVLTRLFPALET
ncbi:phospholipase DDHD1-like isoform X2 [Apis laboriosa]|uniref:phospholipase DDHD1-like isoform X2 n=1 Tax=Apis laboriosa TaxID=183418 RepID=UPI001CC34DD3|nr:phospholipase DDHD1-like isoform X2 [Apis laboriosa]